MKMSAYIVAALCMLWSCSAFADALMLSTNGKALGRVTVSDLDAALTLTVDLGRDLPLETHVVARFQNNSPQQRTATGEWVSWNEQTDSLIDNGFGPNEDGTITFEMIAQDLSDSYLPIVFTVAYRTPDGLKSGYVVIDQ